MSAPAGLDVVQGPVRDELDRVIDELRRIIVSDFHQIEEVNQYLLLLRGKLLRPALLLLANRVGRPQDPRAVTLAAVVELVHLATLVHDDAVDHSVLRRGQPTVNALWSHQVAVIMGDYLYSRAIIELAEVGSHEATRVMARAANEMSVGEMRQLTAYDALEFTEADYDRLIAAKTASLMSAACELGALVGDERLRGPLASFGHSLGMAFQVADDLLDYTGSADVTGKPTGHDLRERKVTLPLVGAMSRATPSQMDQIRHLFTLVDPSDLEIAAVVDLVKDLGGLEYAREKAVQFADAALRTLDGLPEGPALDALRASVAYATQRNR
ncbi:MAG: polyprenyl synthetase family protein [Gemmatimonadales bacterium]|nr:MAG: polyprenyl synthetase family protein [Gemmatimonadales bacterium]